MNIKDEALSRLENFSNNNLGKYAANRNFDPGPENRNNTSLLSKYISHRIIDEQETIRSAYNKLPYKKIEKGMLKSIDMAMHANLIMLLVGALIAIWIASGIVPMLIYYGLALISPKIFLTILSHG